MLKSTKKITILGIDTSCDDTAISVLTARGKTTQLLSSVVSSQVKLHAQYGGVYPSLAKREHQKNLVPVLVRSLKEAKLLKIRNSKQIQNSKFKTVEKILEREDILRPKLIQFLTKYQKPKIDYIAVTVGPGLEPCLWQGVNFAKALSFFYQIPIIPANHVEAHLLANLLSNPKKLKFPALGLVVSGGHTELVLIPKLGQYQIIGQTLDDAAGECFDKTARILGLGYPGGPSIAKAASQCKPATNCHPEPAGEGSQGNETLRLTPRGDSLSKQIILPRPMLKNPSLDFSFSGLKTAVLYHHQKQPLTIQKSAQYKSAMAREIQQAIIDVLIKKTERAIQKYQVETLLLGGGVTSNAELRKQFQSKTKGLKVALLIPPREFCTDNAAMIAQAACYNIKEATDYQKITVTANLNID
jgi:N6-L-threonylcarbamoyladenine synthase